MSDHINNVACIGLGVMGGNMARHLAGRFSLKVFDTDAARREAVDGAVKAASIAEVAAGSEVVLLSLPGSPVVREVVLGEGGLLRHLEQGTIVIDASTTEPSVSRLLAAELEKAGFEFLDAPVSGGEGGAKAASLSIMVGGKPAIFERCLPVLKTIGKSVVRVGDAGMGEVAKLVNNMIVASTFTVVAEAFALAAKNGLDPTTLFEAIRGGWAGSNVLEVSAPGMIARNFTPGGTVTMMLKDVRYALNLAAESSIPVPATSQANEVFKAAEAAGFGGEAQQAIIKVWELLSGIHVGKSA